MPDTSAEYHRLHALAGEWVGDDTLHPSPWNEARGHATTEVVARLAFDGGVIVVDETRARGDGVERVHVVFGFDAHAGRFVLDRFPAPDPAWQPTAPALGGWDGETLTFLQDTPSGALRYQYAFRSPDYYTFTLSYWESPRGWRTALDGTYHRRTPDRPEEYRHQADAIARTYLAHGAPPEQAEQEAWAVVLQLHRRA